MSRDWYQDIQDLVRLFDQYEGKRPHNPPDDVINFRMCLIREEIQETLDAMLEHDLPKVADGIVDSIVVLLGAAVAYGMDVRPIWNEVFKANMLKVSGPIREDGKRLKPSGWKPPDIKKILSEQGG